MPNWATNWYNCIYCGVAIKRSILPQRGKHPGKLQVPAAGSREHIYPAGRGGWLTVPTCVHCNNRRADRPLSVFWKDPWLKARREWAKTTGSYHAPAPAAELARLYLRGRPRNTRWAGALLG